MTRLVNMSPRSCQAFLTHFKEVFNVSPQEKNQKMMLRIGRIRKLVDELGKSELVSFLLSSIAR
jgi:hypothetical protein